MWLATTQGFYSVVEDPHSDLLVVRCRVKKDLMALKAQIPELKPIHGAGTDYAWRAFVPRERWAEAARELSEAIDYGNFKDAVKERQGDRRASVYMRVWAALLTLQPWHLMQQKVDFSRGR